MLYLSFSPKFSLGLSKELNHVRYRVGLDMKYFSVCCDLQNLLILLYQTLHTSRCTFSY